MRDRQPKVFLCYTKSDVELALWLFEMLLAAGCRPWLDKRCLLPGDDWKREIRRAVFDSDAFVACLRPGFDDIGFRQQEVKWALDALSRRPLGRAFIIPYVVEPCELPEWCCDLHAGSDLQTGTTIGELLAALSKHCEVNLNMGAASEGIASPTATPLYDSRQIEGALVVLRDYLRVAEGNRLLIICDGTSRSTAECLRHVALTHLRGQVTVFLLGEAALNEMKGVVPLDLDRAMKRATHLVLLAARGGPRAAFRSILLNRSSEHACERVGLMPNISLSYLHYCNADVEKIAADSASVAAAIGRASTAGLITRSRSGANFELVFGVRDYAPVMSSGVIAENTWGNIPAGETFVVPDLGSAQGRVAINLGVQDVLLEGKTVELSLEDGRLVDVQSESAEALEVIRTLVLDERGNEVTANSSVLAEIGVGLNPLIKELIGDPLFDEKRFGAVHIGFGSSIQFGGPTKCRVHIDFLTDPVEMKLDGVEFQVETLTRGAADVAL